MVKTGTIRVGPFKNFKKYMAAVKVFSGTYVDLTKNLKKKKIGHVSVSSYNREISRRPNPFHNVLHQRFIEKLKCYFFSLFEII